MARSKPKRSGIIRQNKGKHFTFEGQNIYIEQLVRGEVVAKDEAEARKKLQRRGIRPLRISKVKAVRKRRITQEDITVFTRQLATMMKAGLPLIQAFEIVARAHSNPAMTQMLMQVRAEVEQGRALGESFAQYPKYFDRFYCNLVAAGEVGGVLDNLLDKLAVYKEKTQAIKKKVKTALIYPISIIVVAVMLMFVMMMFVLPAFKDVYSGMGTELPWLTQMVMNVSDLFVEYGWIMMIGLMLIGLVIYKRYQNSPSWQKRGDTVLLKLPVFGRIVQKAILARWARTTSTLFAAGVPLVEVLDSVAGASGNILYEEATQDICAKVTQGLSLTSGMQATDLFPNMVIQMTAVGEESGSLDDMLNKVAEIYEDEVDNAVAQLSSLMEPIIMVVLGSLIGVLLVAMYLPLFNLGNVVG
ncbi:type II secretion system F family protein [Neisseria sp. CCUG17229]|uniref:type II secretion system F family protein n=1 Tax=Neisseria sp. CCUG17229 TaxID=3392036 RepID=UPI003A1030D4